MPKGDLACSGNGSCLPGSKICLSVAVEGHRVGFICEDCARDDYYLRAFLVAAGWLHGWPRLRFNYWNAGKETQLRMALMGVIAEESAAFDEARSARVRRRIVWAVSGAPGTRP